MIDFEPTEEQALIVETVRQFAANEIRPRAREADESAAAARRGVLEQAHELGLVANALPEAFGGGGERSAVTGALIAEELALGRSRDRARDPLARARRVPGRRLRQRRAAPGAAAALRRARPSGPARSR